MSIDIHTGTADKKLYAASKYASKDIPVKDEKKEDHLSKRSEPSRVSGLQWEKKTTSIDGTKNEKTEIVLSSVEEDTVRIAPSLLLSSNVLAPENNKRSFKARASDKLLSFYKEAFTKFTDSYGSSKTANFVMDKFTAKMKLEVIMFTLGRIGTPSKEIEEMKVAIREEQLKVVDDKLTHYAYTKAMLDTMGAA